MNVNRMNVFCDELALCRETTTRMMAWTLYARRSPVIRKKRNGGRLTAFRPEQGFPEEPANNFKKRKRCFFWQAPEPRVRDIAHQA